MIVHRIRSQDDYATGYARRRLAHEAWRSVEGSIVSRGKGATFSIRGISYPAKRVVDFSVSRDGDASIQPNWRETVTCPITGLSARLRASVHLLDTEVGLCPGEGLYLTEQSTALYRHLKAAHGNVVGSEYLGPVGRGQLDTVSGLRNEDLTQLTFEDASFDVVGCFECLEHIPNDQLAISELARVIRPSGRLLLSVPFAANRVNTLQRAEIDRTGRITHHEPPEYHGDPLSAEGCLCFRHYGWDLLTQLRSAGFLDAYAVSYWSDAYCYFGPHQLMFVASK